MVIAADYPLFEIFWTMLIFFLLVIWFAILIRVIGDIFGRHDMSGWGKAAWTLLVIGLPFVGIFIYLIVSGERMGQRDLDQTYGSRAQFDEPARAVSGSDGTASEIEKANKCSTPDHHARRA